MARFAGLPQFEFSYPRIKKGGGFGDLLGKLIKIGGSIAATATGNPALGVAIAAGSQGAGTAIQGGDVSDVILSAVESGAKRGIGDLASDAPDIELPDEEDSIIGDAMGLGNYFGVLPVSRPRGLVY